MTRSNDEERNVTSLFSPKPEHQSCVPAKCATVLVVRISTKSASWPRKAIEENEVAADELSQWIPGGRDEAAEVAAVLRILVGAEVGVSSRCK